MRCNTAYIEAYTGCLWSTYKWRYLGWYFVDLVVLDATVVCGSVNKISALFLRHTNKRWFTRRFFEIICRFGNIWKNAIRVSSSIWIKTELSGHSLAFRISWDRPFEFVKTALLYDPQSIVVRKLYQSRVSAWKIFHFIYGRVTGEQANGGEGRKMFNI